MRHLNPDKTIYLETRFKILAAQTVATIIFVIWDLILPVGVVRLEIIITTRTSERANVTSHAIAYPKPNANQKKLKIGPRIPNPDVKVRLWRLSC